MDKFFQQIIKYRAENNLPPDTLERLETDKIIIENKNEICMYLMCGNKL
ncbi:hypothetical protein SAMN05444338_11841 [Flavobacterium degerlachei]|jgi:hypothetical protein|uniref:Uncharacterized protein n=1 Tax=Flavobacterium degerlachei TaxID=229203 RepID=A0A1H3FNP8_9FLAO|nr:hypothetical protein SAMN05444338_11841 [Flavobacterium degerlachei]